MLRLLYWNKFNRHKRHKRLDSILKVTVDFVAEVITCIKDKDKKIISGSPDKIKKIYDTWVFLEIQDQAIQIGS